MSMTIDSIKTRMEQLERQRQQLQANLHAVDGAMQDCEYWLARLQDNTTEGEPS